MKKNKFFILFLSFSFCFSSCFLKKTEYEIKFDNSEPLALIPNVKWAVIKSPYVALHENAGWSFPVKSHCRKGEIYRITGDKTVVNENGISEKWLCIKDYWLTETSVVICYNKFCAKTVSEDVLK